MPVARHRFAATDAARLRFENSRTSRLSFATTRVARLRFDGSVVPFFPLPSSGGHAELYLLGTPMSIRTGETVWVGPGGMRLSRAEAEGPLPEGTLQELHMGSCGVQPGAGQFVYTVFLNGEATSCAFTLTGTPVKGNSKSAVSWPEGGLFALRVQNVGAPEAYHRGSMVFDPATAEP